jgi:calcium-translocating P-type ATPase
MAEPSAAPDVVSAEIPIFDEHGKFTIHGITEFVALEKEVCRKSMTAIGGLDKLCAHLKLDRATGLTKSQVEESRAAYGRNEFPDSPMSSYLELWWGALQDPVLMVLLAAAAVSLAIGIWQHGEEGWVEGGSIFIAVFLVSNLSASNDYSKQLQFKALEKSSADDDICSVKRDGIVELINPAELVVGDIIVLQAGDKIPADSIVIDKIEVLSSQASLTGEPEDLKKSIAKDFALYSACLITASEDKIEALVMGTGVNSQWGKIKANLVTESVNTPLQEKLEIMTTQIGYIGMVAALGTFVALIIRIWAGVDPAKITDAWITDGVIQAFILGVTIVVVAIPEGLPLAVTIALAYSTKKMYKDQCFIRVLAACETMGNATNICSDKTGTLTENLMTVVEGWFGGKKYDQDAFQSMQLTQTVKDFIGHHVAINRTAYLIYVDKAGKTLFRPDVIGNKTEGALILMCRGWGYDYDDLKNKLFSLDKKDKVFSFNSDKKRSTGVLHLPNGSVRLYVKGASEWILKDCTKFSDENGAPQSMTEAKRSELDKLIEEMADRALRTLCLAHVDFASESAMPADWETNPPDMANLTLDCIVGIIDPLRGDVKEAVRIAQEAGVVVRMVTGDNVATARAIARQCGILTADGEAVEGPAFRKMTPAQVDALLPKLQVLARSSPDDKHLLVTRLNGHAIPDDQAAWEELHSKNPNAKWDTHKDLLLPGYKEEWEKTRPNGGQVVGVTGDGTNDAPALKAADVGLAMGITGTKVAQGAADIVILDDKFSSIVKAILWGRSVFDNIRRFLQFQLTVNVVALLLVFIGAVCGFGLPLTAVQMLWVNLVMDTMGALALGTEPPTPSLLKRKPYKRDSSLVSRPMWRQIFGQSAFQLTLLFILMFAGAKLFNVHDMSEKPCKRYGVTKSTTLWDRTTKKASTSGTVKCSSFKPACDYANLGYNTDCLKHEFKIWTYGIKLSDLENYEATCLKCEYLDYTHSTIIFNTFIWCQFFNEFNARKILNEWNPLEGIQNNPMFIYVALFTLGAQIFLVEVGGKITSTTHLDPVQWIVTVALGAISIPVMMLVRLIPIEEDPDCFFDNGSIDPLKTKSKPDLSPSNSYSKVAVSIKELEMEGVTSAKDV